jgi:hypothetical protein
MVVMAAFVWCGPDQFDDYELLELLPMQGGGYN